MLTEKLKQLGIQDDDLNAITEAIDSKAIELAQEMTESKIAELEESNKAKVQELLESEKESILAEQKEIVDDFVEKFDSYAKELVEFVEAKYKEQFESEAKALVEHYEDKLDAYSKELVQKLNESNATQNGLKVAMAEELIATVSNVFSQYSLELPEAPNFEDAINEHVEELETTIADLEKQTQELQKALNEKVKQEIFNEVSEGLSIKQTETLKVLSESILMTNEELYKERLKTIAESISEGKSDSALSESVKADGNEENKDKKGINAELYLKYANM